MLRATKKRDAMRDMSDEIVGLSGLAYCVKGNLKFFD